LRENKLVALVADRDFGLSGLELNFLNRRAMIPKGAAVFAAKTGAGIVPTFLIRNRDDRFTMIFEEPIFAPSEDGGKSEEERVLSIMERYTRVIERKIREYPTQWLMFREFWSK